MKDKYKFITEGKIPSAILKLALPLMLSMFLQNAVELVDLYYVGQLGKLQLAAVTMSSLFIRFVYTFTLGASIGTIALVSRFHGSGEIEKAKEVGKQSIFLGIIMYLIVATVINAALHPVLLMLGAKSAFMGDALIYGRILITGSIAMFIPMAISAYLQGSGDTITPMIALVLSVILNVILDPIFIFGHFGFPAMGVAGSAIATVLSRTAGFIFLVYHITTRSENLRIPLLPPNFDLQMMWRIFKIGIFSSIQGITRNFATLAIMTPVAMFGAGAIAAYGVGVRLRMVILLPIAGLGMATATMVGQNMGADKVQRSSESAWLSVLVGEVLMVSAAILFFFKSGDFISFFNKDASVLANGVLYFNYFAPAIPFLCLSIILERALGGAGETLYPMIITFIFTFLLRVGLAWLLVKDYGLNGVWTAYSLSIILEGIVIAILFAAGSWKRKKV